MLRIDQKNFSAEPAGEDIMNQGRADGSLPGTGPDDRHGSGMEYFVQVVDAHDLEARGQRSETRDQNKKVKKPKSE
jgi:hypothetical protein